MKNILIVFGTRPEAIKMAPVVLQLKKETTFDVKVAVTAQHRQMLDQVLSLFQIVPDFDLNLMRENQDLYDITAGVLIGLRAVLDDFSPDLVLVHGDTATTLAATLAAFYQKIPVGHIEAGLRTGDLYSPWPEEANRLLTSRIANYHFAPTEANKMTLIEEGVPTKKIIVTGNTIIDSLHLTIDRIFASDQLRKTILRSLRQSGLKAGILNKRFILITSHRRENFGFGINNICAALTKLAIRYPDTHFVYPVHLNPNISDTVHNTLGNVSNIHLIKPLDYPSFVYLMQKSYLILTDSGGIQEEAPGLGKPVLVFRQSTERPEAVQAGTVKLVGTNEQAIFNETSQLLDNQELYNNMTTAKNPLGDGNASSKIVNFLKEQMK